MRQRMVFSLFLLLFPLFLEAATSAPEPLTMKVEPSPAFIDEDITIRLISSKRQSGLDMGRLSENFQVLGRRSSSSSSVVNGVATHAYETQIVVRAKRSGKLLVPAIQVSGESAGPQPVEVLERVASATNKRLSDLFLTTLVHPPEAYVGQQVMLRQQLHSRSGISGGELLAPTIPNGVVERIGDDKNYSTIVDGVRYSVIERTYAVFPESAGEIRVDGGRFSGQIDDGNSRSMFRTTRRANAVAPSIDLHVKAPPLSARGHWLPASKLVASSALVPADAELRVGEPVTLTLRIEADGILGSALPEMGLQPTEVFSVYAEPGSQETRASAAGVTGVRELSIALIPQQAGRVAIPAAEISWWDVVSDTQQTARIEAIVVDVLPAAASDLPATAAVAAPSVTGMPTDGDSVIPVVAGSSWLAWVVALSFGLLWLLTFVALLVLVRRQRLARASEKPSRPQRVKRVPIAELRKALNSGDSVRASAMLCAWAGGEVAEDIASLPLAAIVLERKAADPENGAELAALIRGFDNSRFGVAEPVEPNVLLAACQAWGAKPSNPGSTKPQLPGLYS